MSKDKVGRSWKAEQVRMALEYFSIDDIRALVIEIEMRVRDSKPSAAGTKRSPIARRKCQS